ncbi:MAG: HAMP domain-containing sensor histidine kinase [Zetaproteobacteria bacterium]|nr:HAMP domain-containing sensor histidine kinase [Zetaproteobacteria bacterium]
MFYYLVPEVRISDPQLLAAWKSQYRDDHLSFMKIVFPLLSLVSVIQLFAVDLPEGFQPQADFIFVRIFSGACLLAGLYFSTYFVKFYLVPVTLAFALCFIMQLHLMVVEPKIPFFIAPAYPIIFTLMLWRNALYSLAIVFVMHMAGFYWMQDIFRDSLSVVSHYGSILTFSSLIIVGLRSSLRLDIDLFLKNHAIAENNRHLTQLNQELEQKNHAIQVLQADMLVKDRMSNLGVLATGFAHQFNNILNTIKMKAMLLERQAGPEAQVQIQAMYHAITVGADMVESICLSDSQNTVIHPLQVAKFVTSAERLVKGRLGEETQLHNQVPEDYTALGKDLNLLNILLVLFGNAADAQAAHIWVYLEGDTLVVEDDGTGIPPELVAQIFTMFFTTKQKGKGTGIGLAVARRDAEDMHAQLACDVDYQGGARFKLTFQQEAAV